MPASPVHHTAVDKTSSWDGGAAEKSFDKKSAEFPLFYAWYDKGEVDPDADGTDKEDGWGPHHDVNSAGVPGAANLAGVHAAMAALNGGRSNSRIPNGDRQGVYNHLVAHLKDAGVDPADIPELKSEVNGEIRDIVNDYQPKPYDANGEGAGEPVTCPNCGKGDADDAKFCDQCGFKLQGANGVTVNDDGSRSAKRKPRVHRTLDVSGKEERVFTVPVEIRSGGAASDANTVTLAGTVVVYGATYQVNDLFGAFNETIHQGAATQLLESPDLDVRFLFNHDGMPMARTGSEACPLVVTEDAEGVHVEATLDTRMSVAADLVEAIRNGLITQMSVGMQVAEDGDIWSNPDDSGIPQDRDIIRLANIFDTSAVTYPASPTTTISARSAMAYEAARAVRSGRATQRDGELVMRALERLALRDAPTPQDANVSDKIAAVGHAIQDLKDAQSKDPDANTDPDDKKVSSAIANLSAAHDAVIAAQTKDQNPDKPEAPEEKSDGEESEGADTEGNEDGTNESAGDTGMMDDRLAMLQAELRQRRAAVEASRRRLAVEKARLRV